MLNTKKFRAIGMMAAMMARSKVNDENATANDVIALTPLLKEWAEGAFVTGDVRVYEGYPYKCVQDHDSTGNAAWNPKDAVSLWANFHATDAQYALPYVAPTGAHDAYNAGEYMIFTDYIIYMCLVDNTVHAPDVLTTAWKAMP